MLNLIIAILCSAMVSVIMRISEKHLKGNLGMTLTNYVVCVILAAVFSGVHNLFPKMEGVGFTVGIGIFTGCLYLAGMLLIQMNIKKNGVVLTAIFQKLGLVIQILISILFFKEEPGLMQITGIIIGVMAVVLINFEKEQTTLGFKLGLLLLLINSGFCDGMSKVQEEIGNPELSPHFLLYTFGAALVLCIILILVKRESVGWKHIGFGLLLGIPNYFTSHFLLQALGEVPAVIAFPMFSVATIVVITLAGLFVFKEKLSKKQWISLGMILFALVLLNL